LTSDAPQRQSSFVHAPVVSFRASRTYVHSTDLYPELMAGAAAAGWTPIDGVVDLRFRSRITTQPEFHFAPEDWPESANGAENVAGEFDLCVGSRLRRGWIAASGRPVEGRKPYDERPIWDLAVLSERRVRITGDSNMAPIEVITALGLLLHRTELPPASDRRWLLARLSLLRPLEPADARGTVVTMDHVIAGAMTRSSLAASRGLIGTMTFILAAA
jgi:hypothetical protein